MSVSEEWNMVCPGCGEDDGLDVQAKVFVRLCSDGTDTDASSNGDHEWDDDSLCQCGHCGWDGKVDEARKAWKAKQPPRTFDVTVSVTVTDEEALIYLAHVWLVKHGGVQTMDEARARLVEGSENAVGDALRLLIDPGTDIGGVSVSDSTVVEII